MEARLLGSGGWLPTQRRETASVYLRDGDDVLLLDAGSGAGRLVTEPWLLHGVERLFVVLTHFHLDHTIGLIGLPALSHVPERELWAPGRILDGTDAGELVHRLLGPPFLASSADVTKSLTTAVHDLEATATIGPFELELRVQPRHPGGSVAIRVGDALAYCTDTAYDADNAGFARGAGLLLHEAFHPGDTTNDTMHSAAGEAARVAADAGVERLVLVHVAPTHPDDDGLLEAAAERFPATSVGTDLLRLL
jgi:ribonuclease BN (tRNA processing enzyme)